MTTEDKSRAEFEAFVRDTANWLDLRRYEAPHLHGAYSGEDGVERLWQFWQASRMAALEEAIGVLDEIEASNSEEGVSYYLHKIEMAIRELAAKTQGE